MRLSQGVHAEATVDWPKEAQDPKEEATASAASPERDADRACLASLSFEVFRSSRPVLPPL
jgi:hypothetical protein